MNLADRDGQVAQSHCTLHIAHCTITLHISVYCLHFAHCTLQFAPCTTALVGRPLKSDAEQKKAREQRNSAELSWRQFQKYLFHRRIKIPEFSPPLEGKAMHFEMEFIEQETENLGPRVKKGDGKYGSQSEGNRIPECIAPQVSLSKSSRVKSKLLGSSSSFRGGAFTSLHLTFHN